MTKAIDIEKFSRELLKVENWRDYCYNGLQVEGSVMVEKIVVGVSLSEKLINKAIEKKAEMIIVHHGFFGNQFSENPRIVSFLRSRLKLLLQNDVNLLGFHLPLDGHIEIGNNISLARLLELENIRPLNEQKDNIGFIGELKDETSLEDFATIVDQKLDTKSFFVKGKATVKTVAVVSGVSSSDYYEAKIAGADVLLCGDMRENIVRQAEEVGISLINAGHYNTEKLGVINLGEQIKNKFNVQVEFVDIPNPI